MYFLYKKSAHLNFTQFLGFSRLLHVVNDTIVKTCIFEFLNSFDIFAREHVNWIKQQRASALMSVCRFMLQIITEVSIIAVGSDMLKILMKNVIANL